MVPLDSRYTQVGFDFISVQVCQPLGQVWIRAGPQGILMLLPHINTTVFIEWGCLVCRQTSRQLMSCPNSP